MSEPLHRLKTARLDVDPSCQMTHAPQGCCIVRFRPWLVGNRQVKVGQLSLAADRSGVVSDDRRASMQIMVETGKDFENVNPAGASAGSRSFNTARTRPLKIIMYVQLK